MPARSGTVRSGRTAPSIPSPLSASTPPPWRPLPVERHAVTLPPCHPFAVRDDRHRDRLCPLPTVRQYLVALHALVSDAQSLLAARLSPRHPELETLWHAVYRQASSTERTGTTSSTEPDHRRSQGDWTWTSQKGMRPRACRSAVPKHLLIFQRVRQRSPMHHARHGQ